MSDTPAASDAGTPEPDKPALPQQTAAELMADTLGHDLLDLLVYEVGQTVTWKGMTESQMQVVINRLRDRVQKLVTEALGIMLKGEYPNCRAVLESLTIKDGIKATLKIARTEHHLVELSEHVGTPVVLVMVDPARYLERMDEIRAERDQKDLFDESGNIKVASDQPGETTAEGGAAADADGETGGTAAEKTPEPWTQAKAALDRINVLVDDETAKAWTVDQCTEAVFWVQIIEGIPKTAPPAPAHVKIPAGWKRPRKRSS